MSFFNFLKPAKISDQLVGKDEKVCSCSVRIAALLQKSSRENKKSTGSPGDLGPAQETKQ